MIILTHSEVVLCTTYLNFLHFLVNYKDLLYNAIKSNDLAMVKELFKNDSTLVNEHITDGYR